MFSSCFRKDGAQMNTQEKIRDVKENVVIDTSKLGPRYAMISSSKSYYVAKHPQHLVVFNANVCYVDDDNKINIIWNGDLDVTIKSEALQDLADLLKSKVYVINEFFQKPSLEFPCTIFYPK